jgi:ribonucleoside-diphosphate reductase alpha subunit
MSNTDLKDHKLEQVREPRKSGWRNQSGEASDGGEYEKVLKISADEKETLVPASSSTNDIAAEEKGENRDLSTSSQELVDFETRPSSSPLPQRMYVQKRDGSYEKVHFDKITKRIEGLCYGLDKNYVSPETIALKVTRGIYPGVPTTKLDELAAETAAYMATDHPDYSTLGGRIAMSNTHKQTLTSFAETCKMLRDYKNPANGEPAPLISQEVCDIANKHSAFFDDIIDYDQDLEYDFFGIQTLQHSYLLKMHNKVVERPQHMLMRVAIGIHGKDLDNVERTYRLLSEGHYTHASPTLFNAGTDHPQLSSCFLLQMQDDSIDGIYDTLKQCAVISKYAGGIGLAIHNIRSFGTYIRGTNGNSNGIVPMIRVFNNTARYVDQGGGKRKGAFALYLEPWHADIFDFLKLRENHGEEELRARDLFYALWVPDLFMEKVKQNQEWCLFSPNVAKDLYEVWGDEFRQRYEYYEEQRMYQKKVPAQTLWKAILRSQMETGTPYMLYKDNCNRKSNQQNLGTIQCSNLCTEIVEYTSPDEIAVCNLASIALNKFVCNYDEATHTYQEVDHKKLAEVTRVVTRNLNRIIDTNYYPLKEMETSNFRHRPIGIGVQGLADALMLMGVPYHSERAREINRQMFGTMYYSAARESVELAKAEGPYETFAGSPASQGKLQPDLWDVDPAQLCPQWDWDKLRKDVTTHGLRNSLLIAPMPTASTAQILGNNESFEPYTSNMYVRRVNAGEYTCVNRHMLRDFIRRGIWDSDMKQRLMAHKGSVQSLDRVPNDLKEMYKTVWEIPQRFIVDMSADRGPFICQSQSLNIHMEDPTVAKLSSMLFYAHESGLKTCPYYLRTRPKADALPFTVDPSYLPGYTSSGPSSSSSSDQIFGPSSDTTTTTTTTKTTPKQNNDGCAMCGS